MLNMWFFGPAVALTTAMLTALPAIACTNDDVAAIIDATGEHLRVLNTKSRPKIDAKIRALAKKKGWPEASANSRAQSHLNDAKSSSLDKKASKLLMQINRLGDDAEDRAPACDRLKHAKAAAAELVSVTRTRNTQTITRLDAALKSSIKKTAPKTRKQQTARITKSQANTAPHSNKPTIHQPPPAPWQTHELTTVLPPAPANLASRAPTTPAFDPTYSATEIAEAGRGFFGTISSNLAAVIQYAINNYGRPTGYLLGTEGSGAFIAGLRYGSGRLVLKSGQSIKVHWQGPSFGYDVGLTGSRVMFLVYGVKQPDDVYRRFIGIDGSAYVVGGAGITFLKRGKIVMAPIRTGIGLRIGANVGYLKFSPKPSLNPF